MENNSKSSIFLGAAAVVATSSLFLYLYRRYSNSHDKEKSDLASFTMNGNDNPNNKNHSDNHDKTNKKERNNLIYPTNSYETFSNPLLLFPIHIDGFDGMETGEMDTSSRNDKKFKEAEQKFFETYELKEKLGKGGFSTVKRAIHKCTGSTVAVKVIEKKRNNMDIQQLKKEIEILQKIKHPNIINLHDVFETSDHMYLVMDLMSGGELFDQIVTKYRNGYSEFVAAKIIYEIADAMNYVHQMGIIHRDLKPENLLCGGKESEESIKVSDFGLAVALQDPQNETQEGRISGTLQYLAPEVLQCGHYEKSCDLWAIGIIAYILLCGFPPFPLDAKNTREQYELIVKKGGAEFKSPHWDKVSAEAKSLVASLLVVEPQRRITAQEVLQHPWIMKHKYPPSEELQVLGDAIGELKKFNARRKFRTVAQGIIAASRIKRINSLGDKSSNDQSK